MLVLEGSAMPLIAGVLVMTVIYVALLAAEKSWSKRASIPPDCCFPFIKEYGYEGEEKGMKSRNTQDW
ncbi:hypothetical protein SUGI_1006280 [Cryptomeria japonica]|nr:hypothetical protein SUGI_1006280 [Cryptomeria japonica]